MSARDLGGLVLLVLLAVHAGVATAVALGSRRLGRWGFVPAALPPLAACAFAAAAAPGVLAGDPVVEVLPWAPELGLALTVRLDAFSLLATAIVSGIGVLVMAYAVSYFAHDAVAARRIAAPLLAFSGAMLGLVLADDLLTLYLCWELTSVLSFLLIGAGHERGSARAAARQALLTTGAGGLAMFGGFVLLGQTAGTYRLSELLANPPTGPAATAGALLVLIGVATKSAQVPFHTWLPAAMVAPTPVSAYLHSATMVKAGIVLAARLAPAFAETVPGWRPLVATLGVTTMLVGGTRALRQHDLKRLLAFGTVAQLGFLLVLLGVGTPEATRAGVVLLLAHAAFKATLFLVAGIVDSTAGTRDIRQLSGLGRRLPGLAAIAIAAAASMAGLPPLIGFVAKEAAFEALLAGGPLEVAALAGVLVGSALTLAYSLRFLVGAFGDKPAAHAATHDCVGAEVARPAAALVAPAAALGLLGAVLGAAPNLGGGLLVRASLALDPAAKTYGLSLWHGINPALGLSALTVLGGSIVFAVAQRSERRGRRLGWPSALDADEGYRRSLVGLNRVADFVTGNLQNGSLPVYLGVILLTAVALPTSALLRMDDVVLPPRLIDSPLQVVVGAVVAGSALAMVTARRRFVAALLLGGVGYGVAVLFVLQGAPDLALTQLLVESVTLVAFVLVLRHLPTEFRQRRWPLGQALRAGLAVCVGVFVAAAALLAGGVRTATPVSTAFLERALPEAQGRNVVNVILVDFRGLDTLGEITVICVAALGAMGLVRVCRLEAQARRERGPVQSDEAAPRPPRPTAPAPTAPAPTAATPTSGPRR